MPIYQYAVIDANGHWTDDRFEIFQSMHDKPLSTHPESGLPVERVPFIPRVTIDSNIPKTIGDLAQKNTEQMYKRGDPRVTKTGSKASRKKSKIDINKMSPNQIERYIMTGEK